MKIAVSAKSPAPEGDVASQFGRAANFLVFDTENDRWQFVDNASARFATHGAGIQAAQTVCRLGVQVVITGSVGPKAFDVLVAGGVKVYRGDARTALKAMEAFRQGQLSELHQSSGS